MNENVTKIRELIAKFEILNFQQEVFKIIKFEDLAEQTEIRTKNRTNKKTNDKNN